MSWLAFILTPIVGLSSLGPSQDITGESMTNPKELRATGARRDERKDARKRRKRDVAQWKAIIETQPRVGLAPARLRASAVSHRKRLRTGCAPSKSRSRRSFCGLNFVHTYKPKFRCPAAWGLTDQQAQLVAILVDDGEVSNAVAPRAHHQRRDGRQDLDVVLCQTRKKLARFNINLHRRWGRGFS